MVVKSATKKKLMDMLVPEEHAHKLADDRKWDDVKVLTVEQISEYCEIDNETATKIHNIMMNVTGWPPMGAPRLRARSFNISDPTEMRK